MNKFHKRLVWIGTGLGLCFPVMALGLDLVIKDVPLSLAGLNQLHQLNPLHWVIDSAPLVLSSVFYLLGKEVVARETQLTSLDHTVSQKQRMVEFIQEIGNDNLDATYDALEEDEVGPLLVELRDKLKQDAADAQQRHWASEGLTQFADLLRSTSDPTELSDRLVAAIVKYVRANQGGLFVLQSANEAASLELTACYAYGRKKYQTRTILPGEGLIGQGYLEGKTTYLTRLPNNYTRITSGLGEATPTHLLIIPLKTHERVTGVLELAGFKPFAPFEIAFLEKLSESIASVLESVKIAERTQHLLLESEQAAAQQRAQEEVMRQTLEELTATQEAMKRKEAYYQAEIKLLKKGNIA